MRNATCVSLGRSTPRRILYNTHRCLNRCTHLLYSSTFSVLGRLNNGRNLSQNMAGRPSIAEMADLRIAAADEFAGPDFENPITWHRRQKLPTDQLTIDTLFDNIYRKSVTLDQYGVRDHPEYIKWKMWVSKRKKNVIMFVGTVKARCGIFHFSFQP